MLPLLLLLFIVVPILELTIIGQVQQLLGWPTTILILVLDSVVGAYLVRLQGARAWRRFTESIGQMKVPAEEVVDGALILFDGALLLTPGFFTDAVGLVCVLTPTRTLLNRMLRARSTALSGPIGSQFGIGGRRRGQASDPPEGGPPPPRRPRQPGVIDIEVVDVRRSPRDPDDDQP